MNLVEMIIVVLKIGYFGSVCLKFLSVCACLRFELFELIFELVVLLDQRISSTSKTETSKIAYPPGQHQLRRLWFGTRI